MLGIVGAGTLGFSLLHGGSVTMDAIRVGVIGTGFMGKAHALAWRTAPAVFADLPRVALAALCDIDAARVHDCATAWGFARETIDWRALVEDPGIDVVSIASPNALHRAMTLAALAAGKHVWCEKPMAATFDDAEAMAAAARRAGVVTLLGYNYVRNPALRHMKRLIAEGAIGRVVEIRGRFDEGYLADPEAPWSWRLAPDAGLGVLGDMTCHLVALVHDIVGPIVRLTAQVATAHATRPDVRGGRAAVANEDIAQALVELAGGARGMLASSRVAHGFKNALALEVHGSAGTLVFDQERLNELRMFVADGDSATHGFRTILTAPAHAPYGEFCPAPGHQLGFGDLKTIECAELLRGIAGGERPWPDFDAGLEIERVLHAVARSARDGGWVALD